MDLGLRDKVVVVTGGGAGIGEAITRACLAEGARVAVVSRAETNVLALMAELHGKGAACELFETELEDPAQCERAVAAVVERFGGIDALVNNAGVNDGVSLEHSDAAMFEASLRRSLVHYFVMAHHALPALKLTKGVIVNISSKVALTGQGGTSGYAASKGAQLALTREWAVELLKYGIRVNAVMPGEVMTPLYRSWLQSLPDAETRLEKIVSKIPLENRMTTPAEIAAAVLFLLSPLQSGHTTGQQLLVDGGYVHLDRALT